jgi:hydrogenase expression/formation protein HypE
MPKDKNSSAEKRNIVTLGHGSGGRLTHEIIDLFAGHFANPSLDVRNDQATLHWKGNRLVFTTDSFVVTPLFFPGGNIGTLAVHGTVNDLAVGGARPLYLSAGFVIEEGFPLSDLEAVAKSMAEAARQAGVHIVTGDTKVVEHGKADGLFINTAGVGTLLDGATLSVEHVAPKDAVLLSGSIGEHGVSVMARRLGLEMDIQSDTAPLNGLVEVMLKECSRIHAMRDPTRGGLATTLCEMAETASVAMEIEEDAIPMSDSVASACEILGLDPLYVANEGKLLAFVPSEHAEAVLRAMRGHPLGRGAKQIGHVAERSERGRVMLRTLAGGRRQITMLSGELLPRIC